jgi:predicted nucleotidyltransferase
MEGVDLTIFSSLRIQEILRRHKVTSAEIFGSCVYLGIEAGKDIDIIVELEDQADLLDLIGLKFELEEEFHKKVDVVTLGSISQYLRDDIVKQAIPIYHG